MRVVIMLIELKWNWWFEVVVGRWWVELALVIKRGEDKCYER